jgi:ribonuclease HI
MLKQNLPEVIIYTDGACDPNPGSGGWAAILKFQKKIKEITGSENPSTNNRMELIAAIQALNALEVAHNVNLYTDSKYLKLGIEEWMPNWIDRGWKRKGGKLANIELWQKLHEISQKHTIKWHWLKGHTGDEHNERVNRLAQRAIKYKY